MTPVAFLSDFTSGIDVSYAVGAGCHAVAATNTAMGINVHDAVRALDASVDRADRDTDGIFTVITDDGKGKFFGMRIMPFFNFLNPAPPHSKRHVILALANDGTGVTTDTLP